MNQIDTERMQLKQIIFLLIVIVSLILVLGLLLYSDAGSAEKEDAPGVSQCDRNDCDQAVRQKAERRYLSSAEREDLIRHEGDFDLEESEEIESSLVIMQGKARLAGRVNGSVLVICGDIELQPSAQIQGDVVCVGGQIDKLSGSRVTGDQIEVSPRSLTSRRSPHRKSESSKHHSTREASLINTEGKAVYNRVDGLFLGVSLPVRETHDPEVGADVYGFGGYGFSGKRWQYMAGGELYAGRSFRFALGAELHDFTDTEDEWIIPDEENSLAAFFIREDFRDYYRRDGFSLYARQNSEFVNLKAGYRADDLFSLGKRKVWTLFGGDKKFRDNPSIEEGQWAGYFAEFSFDTRDHTERPNRGWLATATAEFTSPDFDSDFDYDRLIVDVRRYQPVGYGRNLDLRVRAGSSRGNLPPQFAFDLGGISTLRGFRFKEFSGDRMVLANLEYRLNTGSSRLHDIPIVGEFNLILFADAGWTWLANGNSRFDAAFDELTVDAIKSDYGVGISDSDGRVRLNIAKRTDRSEKDIAVTFRLNRDF